MKKNFVNNDYTFSPRYYSSEDTNNEQLDYESDEVVVNTTLKEKKRRKIFYSVCISIIVVMLILICIFSTVCSPIIILGKSMFPTLKEGDVIFINRLNTEPKFQEIVVFWRKDDITGKPKQIVKRCVGVPGDNIKIIDGVLYRNGDIVNETYLGSNNSDSEYGIYLETDCYFMLGDNRTSSKDSRGYGAIHKRDIVGVKI